MTCLRFKTRGRQICALTEEQRSTTTNPEPKKNKENIYSKNVGAMSDSNYKMKLDFADNPQSKEEPHSKEEPLYKNMSGMEVTPYFHITNCKDMKLILFRINSSKIG